MAQKCRLLLLLPLAAVALVATARLATAQSAGIDGLRFTTAFPFMTENATLEAGSYTVTHVGANPRLLQFTNDATRKTTLVTVDRSKLPARLPYPTGVSFEHSGDTYLLSRIWDATSGIAADAVKPAGGTVSVGRPTFTNVPATKRDAHQ
jgi:hypothetical protein